MDDATLTDMAEKPAEGLVGGGCRGRAGRGLFRNPFSSSGRSRSVGFRPNSSAVPPGPCIFQAVFEGGERVLPLALPQLHVAQDHRPGSPAAATGAPAGGRGDSGCPGGQTKALHFGPGSGRARSCSAIRGHCPANRSSGTGAIWACVKPGRGSLNLRTAFSRKCAANNGMSSFAFAQRRHLHRKHIQPVIKVLAKRPASTSLEDRGWWPQ